MTEDEMVGWHQQHNGHGFWWTPGVGDGQGGLFRMDWLDLLAVQGTLKSLLQQHSSNASILLHSTTLTSIHDHRKNHSLD